MIVNRSHRFGALCIAFLVCMFSVDTRAAQIDTIAREAVLIDVTTGTTLLEKNANSRMPTSSMSKIMTMYMVFEALREGRLSLDDTLPVSEKAWRTGGSKMFVELNNRIRVEDLIRGVIVQSGNDASVVLAEALGGSEEAFAEMMNRKAAELGMNDSHFTNATGWPDENHYSTAHDLALLAQHIIREFPEYYHYYSETEFTYHDIKQGNRNPLLYRNMNVDGLKTGHTEVAGYGLTASAERNGRRLVLVVNGLPDMQARADESARLLEWGFREFDMISLFKAGETVVEAAVWQGTAKSVPLVIGSDLNVTLNRSEKDEMKVTVVHDEPVAAPVVTGTQLGKVVVSVGDVPPIEAPLVAGADVAELGFFSRAIASTIHLVLGAE